MTYIPTPRPNIMPIIIATQPKYIPSHHSKQEISQKFPINYDLYDRDWYTPILISAAAIVLFFLFVRLIRFFEEKE